MGVEDIAERERYHAELGRLDVDLDRLVGIAEGYLQQPDAANKRVAYELLNAIESFYGGIPYWKFAELAQAKENLPLLKTAMPGLFDRDEAFSRVRQAVLQAKQEDALKQIKEIAGKIKKAHSDYAEKLSIDKGEESRKNL